MDQLAELPGTPASVDRWMRIRGRLALLAAVAAPLVTTAALVPVRGSFANTDAALVLVAVTVAIAAAGSRPAGYLAAAFSAAWFDFFLTRPYQTLNITRRSDVETTVLLVMIGVAVTELAVWGRRSRTTSTWRGGYLKDLYDTAEAAAAGTAPRVLLDQATDRLGRLLQLRSCRFQRGIAGLGVAGRLLHDGSVTVAGQSWPLEERGMPAGLLELLVQSRGRLHGRFVLTPREGAKPPLEHRLVAVTLANQVAAALAAQD